MRRSRRSACAAFLIVLTCFCVSTVLCPSCKKRKPEKKFTEKKIPKKKYAFCEFLKGLEKEYGKGYEKPLQVAVLYGDFTKVKMLLRRGADVDDQDAFFHISPVFIAATCGEKEIAEYLIARGADVRAGIGNDGPTILSFAADGKMAELLIKKGVDVNAENSVGMPPIDEILSELIGFNDNKNVKNEVKRLREIVDVLTAHGGKPGIFGAVRMRDTRRVKKLAENMNNLNKKDMSEKTPLAVASELGYTDIVKILLDHGAEATTTDGDSPLYLAVEKGHEDIVRILLPKLQNGDEKSNFINELLHMAAQLKNEQVVELLIEHGADVNNRDNLGDSPLHDASKEKNNKVVELLIANGANVNAKDSDGDTPLHDASHFGNYKAVDILINHGGNLNAKDGDGGTPLHRASYSGYYKIVKLLVDHDADVNVEDADGNTPLSGLTLDQYLYHYTPKDKNEDYKKVVKKLMDKGAVEGLWESVLIGDYKQTSNLLKTNDIRSDKCGDCEYLIFVAVCNGYMDIAHLLISSGANVNTPRYEGETPLHYAISCGKKKMVELLISKGADVNSKDDDRKTPVFDAIEESKKDIIGILLSHGADINANNKDGETPIFEAIRYGNSKIVEMLLKFGANVNTKNRDGETSLFEAVDSENSKIIEMLLKRGANVNAKNIDGETPLFEAISGDNIRTVELLVKYGANVNIKNKNGDTPLHAAVDNVKEKVVQLLILKGANIKTRDKAGLTPMDHVLLPSQADAARVLMKSGAKADLKTAVIISDVVLAKKLLKNGADIKWRYKRGKCEDEPCHGKNATLLHFAAAYGYLNMTRLLIDNGANLNAKDVEGKTPLDFALETSFWKTAILLLRSGAKADKSDLNELLEAVVFKGLDKDSAKYLVGKGADLNAKNDDGKTLLRIASDQGYTRAVKILRGLGAK